MPLPSPWVGLVLGLAAYRLTRLGGWDDWPPIASLRRWIIGEVWVMDDYRGDADEIELPGKQPSTPVENLRPAYRRPLLAHLFHCPFCLGWWISLAVYVWWLLMPSWGLYPLAPFALSGFVGLVAKNLDP